ncbi:MAG: hypothetical protein KAF41_00420 [Flavobacterium sp.]|nr:hypothetical protein [Flavobacterium sp.]PZO33752.1 MAG: hypothetical protein DCE86_03905 [Flavobacteriaceae bacterium]
MSTIEHDEITPSEDFIKGFNEGYILAKFSRELTKTDMPNSDRSKGFAKGMMQYEVEKKLEHSMSRFTQDRNDTDHDLTKDKDRDKER